MKTVLINSAGQKIYFGSDFEPAVDFFLNSSIPSIFIPGFSTEIFDKTEPSKEDIVITFVQSPDSKINIDPSEKRITIQDNWQEIIPTYILSFIYTLQQRLYISNSLFSLHSSAVAGTNKNFVIIGKAGSGKTTTALELVTKYNLKYLSNNKTVISSDNLNIEAGTKSITVRESMQNDLSKFIEPKVDSVYGRKVIKFNSKYLGEFNNGLKTIFIKLQLNPAVGEFRQMEYDESMIFLYPQLLDISDREILLFNWTTPLPLTPLSLAEKNKALNLAQKIHQRSAVYHLSGSLDFVCQTIVSLDNNYE